MPDKDEPLTDQQKQELCRKVRARAVLYANNPEMGRRAGYQPEQTYNAGQDNSRKGTPIRVTLRRLETAWLYGVARRDLADHDWRITENLYGYDELTIGDRIGMPKVDDNAS